jgi:hypothetical protein
MKKTFAAIIVGFVCVPLIMNSAHAQQTSRSMLHAPKNMLAGDEPESGTGKFHFEDSRMNEVNMKAVRHLADAFPAAEQVKWYTVKDGFMAYLMVGGFKVRAGYDNKGNWLYNMRTYAEKYLPAAVRKIVKGEYYDYNITVAVEIKKSSGIIYIVHLSNETHFLKLKVCDGQMEEMEMFDRE